MTSDPLAESFEFHFKVEVPNADQPVGEALAEFVRQQLVSLGKVAVLTWQGEPVSCDGFRLRTDPERVIPLLEELHHDDG